VSDRDNPKDRTFSEHFACVKCGTSLPEIEPRTFSFNSPHGACPTCTGLGTFQEFDPELMFDEELSLEKGAVIPWRRQSEDDNDGYYLQVLRAVAKQYGIPFRTPVKELSLKQRDIILYGTPKQGRKGAHRLHEQRGAGTLLRNFV
jgi:excinuclease ABC subunit A